MMKKAMPDKDDAPPGIAGLPPRALERAQEPEDLLTLLKHFGFTNPDISEGTGADERTVRRWNTSHPGKSAAAHLAEIRNIVLLLSDEEILSDRGIVFWMRHPNRLLEDYPPLAVVAAGGFRSALEAAKCFVDSERGFKEPLPESVLRRLESEPTAQAVAA